MATKAILKPFGKIRALIWPIHSFELKKLIPMFAMCFLITFVYNLLHCLKVPLLVKAPGSGAEVIPFLQIVGILPIAVLFTYVYTKLISRFNREQVFYIVISGFLVYFALFLLVLYPHKELLQLDTLADFLQSRIFTGTGSKGLIAAIRNFNLTMFYVLAEMWSVVALFMLFWGFANEVTKVDEAKRFYAIFALGGNSSGILSGVFTRSLESLTFIPVLPAYAGNEWLFLQLCTILLLGSAILYLFWWLNRNVFAKQSRAEKISSDSQKAQHKAISLTECFAFLRKSNYVRYIVLIVMGYYMVYSLTEIMWAHKIESVMASSKEINTYMSTVYSITGVLAVLIAFIVSGNIVRRFGWTIAALVTPVVLVLTSIGFFSGLVFEGSMIFDVISALFSNPANLVLLFGSIQICLGRSCKYTLFDKTKEMAFIPLSKDEQRKSKVLVDGLASRFGKSGGSLIYITLFYIFGEIANVIPYIAVIIFIVLAGWLYATVKMGDIMQKTFKKIKNSQRGKGLAVSPAR